MNNHSGMGKANPKPTSATSPRPAATWSLLVGVVIICLSLWVLHRFCDGYSDSVLIRPPDPSPGTVSPDELPFWSAESICPKRLGALTLVGGFGVASLVTAWLLQRLSTSRRSLKLSGGLAVAGRLIALGLLAIDIMMLLLFNQL